MEELFVIRWTTPGNCSMFFNGFFATYGTWVKDKKNALYIEQSELEKIRAAISLTEEINRQELHGDKI